MESKPGQGTQFQIYFPLTASPQAASAPVIATGSPQKGNSQCILVVEDEEQLRILIARLLGQNGYKVISASSGFEAQQLSPEKISQLDLLFTDMVMPGGVNGYDLAQYYRKTSPHLKVIYCSGYSSQFNEIANAMEPNSDFLPKPFTTEQLLLKVKTQLA